MTPAEVDPYVSWEHFKWALGIVGTVFVGVIGWILKCQAASEACDDHMQAEIAETKTRISVVEANHRNVVEALDEIKQDGRERTKLLQQIIERRGGNRG